MFPKPERPKDRNLLDTYHKMRCTARSKWCVGMVVAHHVRTKKNGGPDIPQNLMPLCVKHHNEVHWSLTDFVHKYASVHNWMLANGWIFDDYMDKWFNEEVYK